MVHAALPRTKINNRGNTGIARSRIAAPADGGTRAGRRMGPRVSGEAPRLRISCFQVPMA
jgi:hypothetical protein